MILIQAQIRLDRESDQRLGFFFINYFFALLSFIVVSSISVIVLQLNSLPYHIQASSKA